ncbi:hypothetical protein IQ247_26390 [Plectonema cf. radiosum LEGE 06105]|uniref:Uncharacterized protein n=1 Tax=Plectonema cf. radiosum LEGE 06105 TaxID=945769 RepID=A0A8J7K705_9CYAN|nr:hypothetical protein [Plectonema radiosum]MBE9216147.1 hypothetical protein [Plectonema cf. radiosum LEGE 06105]
MISQEEITVEVSSEVAQAYRNATEQERKELQLKIAAIIQSEFQTKRQSNIANLRNTMDIASREAQSKGLTPEILELVLRDD